MGVEMEGTQGPERGHKSEWGDKMRIRCIRDGGVLRGSRATGKSLNRGENSQKGFIWGCRGIWGRGLRQAGRGNIGPQKYLHRTRTRGFSYLFLWGGCWWLRKGGDGGSQTLPTPFNILSGDRRLGKKRSKNGPVEEADSKIVGYRCRPTRRIWVLLEGDERWKGRQCTSDG